MDQSLSTNALKIKLWKRKKSNYGNRKILQTVGMQVFIAKS